MTNLPARWTFAAHDPRLLALFSVPVGYEGNFEGSFLDDQRGFELKRAKTAEEIAALFMKAEDARNPDEHGLV